MEMEATGLYGLQLETEAPYRLLYVMHDEDLKQIMRDVYLATCTAIKPPLFKRILSEVMMNGVLVYVFAEHLKRSPERFGMEQQAADTFYEAVMNFGMGENSELLEFTLSHVNDYFLGEFESDIEMFMNIQNYSYLVEDKFNIHSSEETIRNPPVISVW